MSYQPIQNYGIIGDLHTAALVNLNGSIDWLCLPDFDSPSVFAAILDDEKGGRFQIAPADEDVTHKQAYLADTNVLLTHFLTTQGVGEITDFMPIDTEAPGEGEHELIRRVRVARGRMTFRLSCRPAFDYARAKHRVEMAGGNGVVFVSPDVCVALATRVPLREDGQGGVTAEFTLDEEKEAVFLLQQLPDCNSESVALETAQADALFRQTVAYWRRWLSGGSYTGRWREIVNRSALALKLLCYEPTGAIVASPTCSLPEHVGGSRNWDYRYTWVRDAAFSLYALIRIGFTREASRFMEWVDARCHERREDGSLQIMYGIDGRHDLAEEVLTHLDGYRGSRPVRIGNAAHDQLQLDVYGALLDAVYLANKHSGLISYDLWTDVRDLLDFVCRTWQQPDYGVWEVRAKPQPFVYSKVMCWVALDRGLRLAEKRSFPADRRAWFDTRDAIFEAIMAQGWNDEAGSFVQFFGGKSLDAANLIMPLVFFIAPSDPRMLKTIDAIMRPPSKGGLVSNSLVRRYNPADGVDGIAEDEGTFNMCTFWLVEALTRAARNDPARLDQARLIFEKMLGFANHLGLFSEQTGPRGEALGNFPQAFTHLSLISAAYNLDKALNVGAKDWPGRTL